MEYQYASNAKGNLGVTLGAIGSGLSLLNGGLGILGNGGWNNNNYYHNTEGGHFVTKDELNYVQEIGDKNQQIAILQSENFTNSKIADVYERLKADLNSFEKEQSAWNAAQMVNNATISSSIAVNTASISALQNCCNQITKLVVPNTAVCPGWGNVTITPSTTPTTIGS